MKRKLSAKTIYLIYSGATALFFSLMFTASGIYRIDIANLNAMQLVLVGTLLEGACFVFEIPTGIVADVYSRKLSVIIGLIMIGVGFILEGSIPLFIAILASQVMWGVGYTFLSGANEAWIADEVRGEGLDELYLKAAQVGKIFSLMGILISTLLGTIALKLPMILSGILFIMLSCFLIVFMPEKEFIKQEKEDMNSWGAMVDTFKTGMNSIKSNKTLMIILVIALIYGLYSEGIDRLWDAHFLRDMKMPMEDSIKPIVWFGIINAVSMIFSIMGVEVVKRRVKKTGSVGKLKILLFTNMGLIISIILFGLSGDFKYAIIAYCSMYIFRTTNGPIYRAWMNENIQSKVRATVISTFGQVDALGQIIGGPIIGLVAYRASISKGIIFAGILLIPVLVLFFKALKNKKTYEKNMEMSNN